MNRANYEKPKIERQYFGADDFRKANSFLLLLRKHSRTLTSQEVHTLRTMALSGDIAGAERELDKIFLGHERRDLQIGKAEA